MLSSCTDSATEFATICSIVEIFMCRYSRLMKSSNSALVPASAFLSTCFVNSKALLAFIFYFCARPRISHLWRVTRAWLRRCHLQNHSLRRFCQPSGIECVHVHKSFIAWSSFRYFLTGIIQKTAWMFLPMSQDDMIETLIGSPSWTNVFFRKYFQLLYWT